jgi:hypothetical protein
VVRHTVYLDILSDDGLGSVASLVGEDRLSVCPTPVHEPILPDYDETESHHSDTSTGSVYDPPSP